MLFLLKRTWQGGLIGMAVLVAPGLGWRFASGGGPHYAFSVHNLLAGCGVFGVVLLNDGVLHGLLLLLFRERYRQRHQELAAVFERQSLAAMLAGAAMAGLGEELVFRGLGTAPLYLGLAAIAFGVLHHIRRRLWPFTVWAVYEGLLFAGALYMTEALCVTMVAHFLHDLAGFFLFRYLNRRRQSLPS